MIFTEFFRQFGGVFIFWTYVLTLGAVSEGKQYVLFSAEDESGPMVVGHREIITQPAPHLGPLEIIESNFAEGRFVGLLPRQATAGMQ
jgi:hypothetical protein